MNDQKQAQVPSNWITHIHKVFNANRGRCKASDSQGNPILLEWEKIDTLSSRLNEIIKETSDILVHTYVSMELEYARKHPETVDSEMFLKRLAPLFQNGVENVDWKVVEQNLTTHLQQFFVTSDFAKYSGQHDIQIFIVAKDEKSGAQLGVIQFLVTPEFEHGTVKVAFFSVVPSAENRGIEKLLLSTIFKLIPDVTRIFLHTRSTNEKWLNLYQDLGFAEFAGPLPLWADREYLVQKSDLLQKTCNAVKAIK